MNKIILCGYMASGKTTIARQLSVALGFPYVDLDEEIEREAGESVAAIFGRRGEISFRRMEHDTLKEIVEGDRAFVLSLGGGTPCYGGNHLFMLREDVISVYLKAGIPELVKRIQNQQAERPLVANVKHEELEEFVARHLFERSYYYHQAKQVVDTDGKTPENTVNEIMSLF